MGNTHILFNQLVLCPFFKFNFVHYIHLLLLLCIITTQSVVSGDSSVTGDGVMITRTNLLALRAIKREIIDLKSALRSWNDSGSGACSGSWIGIKCVNGQVIAIQLPWRGLGGKISDKIGQLKALRKVSLHDNVLGGTIPWSLGSLPNLRGLYLFNNRLSGSIPPSIGNSHAIQTIDLSNNSLVGFIPPSLANSTRLFRLNLSFNLLSGSIPSSLTRSHSLTILDLQHNNLSGLIPDSWEPSGNGNDTYKLQILALDSNSLSGSIPVSISKLALLQEISLSHNQISGSIPDELGLVIGIQKIDFSNNGLNGSIPASFSNLSSLVLLNLEGNHIGDQIPENFDKLHNLTVLNLKRNQFNGSIPETIGHISGLNQLDLSNNNFTGEIPASLTKIANLTSFNVSYNNLSGAVPSSLTKKFSSSSFVGNLQLCGFSSSTPCTAPGPLNVSPSPTEAPKKHHRRLSVKDIILIAAGILLAILLVLCCVLVICLMKRRASLKGKSSKSAATLSKAEKASPSHGVEVESGGEMGGKLVHFDGPFVFTADDLLCATAEIMGKSTYGTAYKATLEDGNQVAVKRLREKTTKGQKEFEAEAAALGKIRHPNLLAMRAYYLGPKGEKLLVFDYMPKGSLATFLHARGPETTIDWSTRMKIAIGVTRGLNFLHTKENIIHGNLTSSNILLDEQTNAHIADYGISKLMTAAANTNVVATAGTLGYRAPELAKLKNANTKTDVYSLGVVILELLTGKSPSEAMNGGVDLPQWVASIVKEEWTNEVFDLDLMRDTPVSDELLNTLKLALHCVDPTPAARPETQHVLQQLEEIKPEVAAAAVSFCEDEATAPPSPPPTTNE